MPVPSDDCTHPADEWCDACFVPTRHLSTLRALDRDDPPAPAPNFTEQDVLEWQRILSGAGLAGLDAEPPKYATAVPEWDWPVISEDDPQSRVLDAAAVAPIPGQMSLDDVCVNRRGRHVHPGHRRGRDCARPVPPYGYAHRATGAAAVGLLVAAGAGFVLTVRLLDRARVDAEVAHAAVRRRALAELERRAG